MRTLALFVSAGLFTAIGLGSTSAWAATFKVGPSQTYKQPSAVASMLKPGDVVEIDGDATYGSVSFGNAGTAGSKITVRGIRKNGKRPVLSGGTNTLEAAADHYVYEGLDLTAGSSRCFFHHADDITLRDSVVHDCPTHGVLGADSDAGSLTMEYVEVYASGGGIYHHQVYMATDQIAHPGSVFRMQFCYIHDSNGGHNVKSRAERNEIRYNWIEGAEYHELELIGPDGQDGNVREDSDVVGNVLVKRNTWAVVRFGGDGTGDTNGRYRFVNNTVITRPGGSAVFRLFDRVDSLEMHNNVFTVDGAGGVKMMGATDVSWNAGEQIAGTNNWVKRGSTLTPSQWQGTIVGDDPGFVAGVNDPRLSSTSALIDSGASAMNGPAGHAFPSPLAAPTFQPPVRALLAAGAANARPIGGGVDIGAFSYGAASPPVPTPPSTTTPPRSEPPSTPLSTPTPTLPSSGGGTGAGSGPKPVDPNATPDEALACSVSRVGAATSDGSHGAFGFGALAWLAARTRRRNRQGR